MRSARSKSGGAAAWMQISHPGRQVFSGMGMTSLAPSAVPLRMGTYDAMFEKPRALSNAEIHETIRRFVETATLAERAGFDGVEILAAHGYLISQFLSPLANRRQDTWGGSLANRARLLLEVVEGVRTAVAPGFSVAVKLNSADFQRGGFDERDARDVIGLLNERGVDLVELSGGTYESPAMSGQVDDSDRTLAREAYFLRFAVDLLAAARMPLMVTSGIRRRETAEAVVTSGVAVVGLATALALRPDLPTRWRDAESVSPAVPQIFLKDRAIRALATNSYLARQMQRMAAGAPVRLHDSALLTLARAQLRKNRLAKRYKKWLASPSPPSPSSPDRTSRDRTSPLIRGRRRSPSRA